MSEVYSKLITGKNPGLMNFSSRGGHKIDRIVIHHNATTNKNVAMNTWLQSSPAQTSAHYEVTPTEIIGCISESDAAWHCGGTGGADQPKMSYPNQRSIGIENVNSTGAPNWSVAHATVVNTAKLVADICKRYNIPIDRSHILAHREVTATACPGGLNVDEVVKLAKQYYGGSTASKPQSPSNPKPSSPSKPAYSTSGKSLEQMANDVIANKVSSGATRTKLLGKYAAGVQAIVNRKLAGASVNITNIVLANETKAGHYGNGDTRKKLLGSYYNGVQAVINKTAVVYHTVKPGETVSGIATAFKTTTANIVKLNSLKNANLIYAGQRLRVK